MVQLWNVETGEKIGEPFGCTPPITASFNSDGGRIAVMWDHKVADTRTSSRCQMLDGVTGRPIGDPTEHAGTRRSSSFDKDGKRLILGYDLGNGAGEVCVRDAIVGGPLQTLLSFKDEVPEAFDATGVMVITLGIESQRSDEEKPRIARVWNLRTGKPITKPFKHDQDLTGAIFSPDGDHIATLSNERAFMWNMGTDTLVASTEPLPDEKLLWRIGYSPDAKLLLVVGVDHPTKEMDWVAQLRDATTGELVPGGEIRDHGLFRNAVFSQDSQFLLLCSSAHRARVWRTRSVSEIEPEEVAAPLEHADVVSAAKISPDGKRIVTTSFDKTLRVWHVTPGLGRALPEKIPTAQPVHFAESSPHGGRIVLISEQPAGLQLFDGATIQTRSPFIPQAQSVRSVGFSRDDQLLATGGEDGIVTLWDANGGQLVAEFKQAAGEPIDSVKLDATGAHAAIATPSGATLWDIGADRAIPLVRTSTKENSPGMEFTPDGARLLTVHNSELNMWDARSGARIWGPLPHAAGDYGAQARFSPDGTRFAVYGSKSVVDVREAASGKPGYALQHRGVAVDAALAPMAS
jgi:WD40 repeat protein